MLDRKKRPARFGFGDDGEAQPRWNGWNDQASWERDRQTSDLTESGLSALLRSGAERGPDSIARSRLLDRTGNHHRLTFLGKETTLTNDEVNYRNSGSL